MLILENRGCVLSSGGRAFVFKVFFTVEKLCFFQNLTQNH